MESYIVIGGGLAGLTAANALADGGGKVTLFEQSERLGGRAATRHERGYLLNLGPHALYADGRAVRTFREWGIPFSGRRPMVRGRGWLVRGGERFPVFETPGGLLRTRLFGWGEKFEAAAMLRKLQSGRAPAGESMDAWLNRQTRSESVREFAASLVRVSTYCADLENLSAAAALTQVAMAFRGGVLYLDDGWQTLVDGLAARAQRLGVEIRTGAPFDDLKSARADGVVLAVSPEAVERIADVRLPPLRPIRMAALTLGLRRVPPGAATFALAIDRPLYLSVHSATARLAPEGAALVHIGQYLGEPADRAELEAFADLNVPGWRDEAEVVQFLPNLTVSHAAPAPEGRPDVGALNRPGVAIAGDWVGPEGMLADAAVTCGLRAAALLQNRKVRAA
jgi:phytoene dehydrogenase-like protein